jgi:hypothetical protein
LIDRCCFILQDILPFFVPMPLSVSRLLHITPYSTNPSGRWSAGETASRSKGAKDQEMAAEKGERSTSVDSLCSCSDLIPIAARILGRV